MADDKGLVRIERALITVTNKTGLSALVAGLDELGIEIVSTGGTARAIQASGVPVVTVEELTGYQEMLSGRVKVLNPMIFGGILADRSNPEHMAQVKQNKVQLIDLVVVNTYDFQGTIEKAGCTIEEATEAIDIGGPSLTWAAIKNREHVGVLCDPKAYDELLERLRRQDGRLTRLNRICMAATAAGYAADYRHRIADWLSSEREWCGIKLLRGACGELEDE